MSAEKLLELADRIEALKEACREVDACVAAALRVGTDQAWAANYPDWIGRADGRVYLEEGGPSFASPLFTASLDAAMSLVAEGWSPAEIFLEAVNANCEPDWSKALPRFLTAAALRARAKDTPHA